jgi:general secretion pathway protein A
VIEKFQQRSGGIDLARLDGARFSDRGKHLLRVLLDAGTEVIEERQAIINEKFLGYKNVIPATWGTWTSGKFSLRGRVLLKQTALDFRNPNNAPDEFETRILQRFAASDYPREGERIISEVTDGGTTLRLMLPLFHKKDCLTCHGKPKGQIDISGYIKEGHDEGGPAGAISVAIPLASE